MNSIILDIESFLFIVFITQIVYLIISFSKIPTKNNIKLLEKNGILISEYIKGYKKSKYMRCVYIIAINIFICFLYIFIISKPDTNDYNSPYINSMLLLLWTIIALSIISFSLIIYFDRKKRFNKNNTLKYIINNMPDELYEMVYSDIQRNEIDI